MGVEPSEDLGSRKVLTEPPLKNRARCQMSASVLSPYAEQPTATSVAVKKHTDTSCLPRGPRLLPAAECRTSIVCMFRPPPLFGDAFEIRAALRNVEPTVWRTLSVPVHLSLGDLHEILQVAFGWQNSHLHDFVVGEARFGMTDVEDELFCIDEHAAPLGAVARSGSSFVYRYDFGDSWEHEIRVERVVPSAEANIVCTGGARACPPEDCGGVPGFVHLLEVLAHPGHDEHAEMRTWVGNRYDPTKFDLAGINKKLATLSKRLSRREVARPASRRSAR